MLIHETLKMLRGYKTLARWNFQEHASSRGGACPAWQVGQPEKLGYTSLPAVDRHGSHENAAPCHLGGVNF